jgi:hypothetical protein
MGNKGVWVRDPNAGGVKISPAVRTRVTERINRHAEAHYAGKYTRLDIRFKGTFCYIDAYTEPDEPGPGLLKITGETREEYLERVRATPTHLCRLRYFGREEEWGVAFYTYSNDRYELSVFPTGSFYGTVEDAFEIGATYLQ